MKQLSNYQHILSSLKEKIRQARLKAALTVNAQLLSIYWEIGVTILNQQKEEGWGAKVIDKLAARFQPTLDAERDEEPDEPMGSTG